jgi:alpha-glucosidase
VSARPSNASWWREGVLYQIYPRSFADSNGDGIGDLRGILDRLDYLAWLGVAGIWLNPITASLDRDWGYDVSDYRSVHPELGTIEDLDRLVAEAGRRDIRVLLDIVPNHTSDQHPWFVDARSSRSSAHRDWYVWADPKPDGSPPNNWVSVFGGPAWTLHEGTGQFYLHNFLPEQPDLNWWNEDVRTEFDEILRFWFDRGVAGFRIDVAHGIVKDRELRDNPPATEDDPPWLRAIGQRQVHNLNRPEVHDVLRRWRQIADAYEPRRILVGETWAPDLADLAAYYGREDDELHLAFNIAFVFSPLDASEMAPIVEETEKHLASLGWPAWIASNHDVGRLASRWCSGDERKARCALMLLLSLHGTPFLYYGDEIGLPDVPVPRKDLRDLLGIRHGPANPGRDACRTPMPWTAQEGAGFTQPGVRPWLPFGSARPNMEDQRDDPGSVLTLCRRLIELRRTTVDLRLGNYRRLPTPTGSWAWQRGDQHLVAVNLSDEAVSLETPVDGKVLVGTDPDRSGERLDGGEVPLDPWEGVVVSLSLEAGLRQPGSGAGGTLRPSA